MNLKSIGSICSGIEAASVAWKELDVEFKWFSEIGKFQSTLLKEKYPTVENLGNMTTLPEKILNKEIDAPDLICGGTPCQAFSLAGWRNGLEDERGNLTLSFVDIIEANDQVRKEQNLEPTVVFWENVEGVLKDKMNAFGSFVSSLAGLSEVIEHKKWPHAGFIRGPKRNVAWRVLDAKYFGIPQQRKRIYVLAGGVDFYPEDVLFEWHTKPFGQFEKSNLQFKKGETKFELFREYTDVLYAAYGTKWNGNAAAYNGSLFIVQNQRLRRLSPLECERLMGFPDDYTNIEKAKITSRYQALGNSWAVPVIKWIGQRLKKHDQQISTMLTNIEKAQMHNCEMFYEKTAIFEEGILNVSDMPETIMPSTFANIVDEDAPTTIYLSPVGCGGILRRKNERKLKMNGRLEQIMTSIANELSAEEIEKISRRQKRGSYSEHLEKAK